MKITFLNDINNSKYIGLEIPLNYIDINNNSLNNILLKAEQYIPNFKQCNELLLLRNNGIYHITLFNVMEYNKNSNLDDCIGSNIDNIIFKGIGSISLNKYNSYFITIECNFLNHLRHIFNLPKKDFHITIGFTEKDIFNQPKNNTNIYNI